METFLGRFTPGTRGGSLPSYFPAAISCPYRPLIASLRLNFSPLSCMQQSKVSQTPALMESIIFTKAQMNQG